MDDYPMILVCFRQGRLAATLFVAAAVACKTPPPPTAFATSDGAASDAAGGGPDADGTAGATGDIAVADPDTVSVNGPADAHADMLDVAADATAAPDVPVAPDATTPPDTAPDTACSGDACPPAPQGPLFGVGLGSHHSCAVRADGTLWCWGSNERGALGSAGVPTTPKPVQVGKSKWLAVAAGADHSCAIAADQGVACWGLAELGQSGPSKDSEIFTPTAVSGLSGAVSIAAGERHSCAVHGGGKVSCWGHGVEGQLGKDIASSSTPVLVALADAKAVVAGAYHSCALLTDGTVWCWGSNGEGQLGNGGQQASGPVKADTEVVFSALAAGGNHVCGVAATGLYCWGEGDDGQLGNPTQSVQVVPWGPVKLAAKPKAVAAGAQSTCALLVDGKVQCWGDAPYGGLGQGPGIAKSPTAGTPAIGVSDGVGVACGLSHCCSWSATKLWCWGWNARGQLGNGTMGASFAPSPVAVTGAVELAAGMLHTCARLASGKVACWGGGAYGQLGQGGQAPSEKPVEVSGLVDAVSIGAGQVRSCAVRKDGSAQCWGSNVDSALGTGAPDAAALVPVTVMGNKALALPAVGHVFTCFLAQDATVWCAGKLPTDEGQSSPNLVLTKVVGLSNVDAVVASDEHACALVDGDMQCWGENGFAQFGTGNTDPSEVPKKVVGKADFVLVATATDHSCGVTGGKSAWCWGAGAFGQLATGKLDDSAVPVAAAGLAGATKLAVGYRFTCFGDAAGSLKCVGTNATGQLGADVPDTTKLVPVVVQGLTGVKQVVAGHSHACALSATGQVSCWGASDEGAVGNGKALVFTPVVALGLP
ncbi:MAG: hypothetical protein EXR79_06880 [Myxococcales bacterium]|nr:hypothetical protein [Myxococcales bacterium]